MHTAVLTDGQVQKIIAMHLRVSIARLSESQYDSSEKSDCGKAQIEPIQQYENHLAIN